eukprot:365248-Chlamydomonas_euryale.AAC.3
MLPPDFYRDNHSRCGSSRARCKRLQTKIRSERAPPESGPRLCEPPPPDTTLATRCAGLAAWPGMLVIFADRLPKDRPRRGGSGILPEYMYGALGYGHAGSRMFG